MSATQQVFEKPEEDFDRPPFRINQPDDLSRRGEQIGGDSQHAIAVGARGAAFVFAATGVRRTLHAHQANLVIGTCVRLAALTNQDNLVAEYTRCLIRFC